MSHIYLTVSHTFLLSYIPSLKQSTICKGDSVKGDTLKGDTLSEHLVTLTDAVCVVNFYRFNDFVPVSAGTVS